MGPAADRAEFLVDVWLRGERRQHAPAHAHPRLERHQDAHAMSRSSPARPISFPVRLVVVFGLLLAAGVALAGRAVQLQLVQHRFLAGAGAARFTRVAAISAHRGTITDRYGEPPAVSTPVDSVWANPQNLAGNTEPLQRLARAIHADPQELVRRVSTGLDREFLYLGRGLQPADARKVRELNISGVNLSREYRRYYPAGEVTGHLLGFP